VRGGSLYRQMGMGEQDILLLHWIGIWRTLELALGFYDGWMEFL
jgi:hypothetical protein